MQIDSKGPYSAARTRGHIAGQLDTMGYLVMPLLWLPPSWPSFANLTDLEWMFNELLNQLTLETS